MTHRSLLLAGFIISSILMATMAGIVSAQEGPAVGTVAEVKLETMEIVVQSPLSAQTIKMGDRLYLRIEGEAVIMKATFPMQSVAKCMLDTNYAGYFGLIAKGMPVYRFVKGIKEGEERFNPEPKIGTVKKIGGIEFVFIKGGEFKMGSPKGMGQSDERPLHAVKVTSFWMSKYEITQDQYQSIMKTNPSIFKNGNNPVEQVTWDEAFDFCQKFGKKHGVKARLPYEAEWEYACRAGTSTVYYWGNKKDGKYCWYYSNSGDTTHEVGKKLPNAWGLHDMSGNVWEWCMDWHDESYYANSPYHNPKGPSTGSYRVLRGGSYSDTVTRDFIRSAARGLDYPNSKSYVGIRIVFPGP